MRRKFKGCDVIVVGVFVGFSSNAIFDVTTDYTQRFGPFRVRDDSVRKVPATMAQNLHFCTAQLVSGRCL